MAYIVLTGATSGIGLALAHRLADTETLLLQGPESVVTANLSTLEDARYVGADFTSLSQVRELAARILDVGIPDVLINNAGIPGPAKFTRSSDDIEVTFQVNYLAGALLTDILLKEMPSTARILNVASATHYTGCLPLDDLDFTAEPYSAVSAYARSKLAIVTASRSLAQRVPQHVVSIHPGVVSTDLLHAMFGAGGEPTDIGARNIAAAINVDVPTGTYLDETAPAYPNPAADDPDLQDRLRFVTSQFVRQQIR